MINDWASKYLPSIAQEIPVQLTDLAAAQWARLDPPFCDLAQLQRSEETEVENQPPG